ncbi:hypothetical protein APUTEX25_002390 [Auxenochlorella protothecoides]|uniref:Polyamine transporter n=1 Tax=Auxenochlorella protothecoides TaxID=3075 RepID=A0A3M7L2F8_AUXPR|nr:hypothetical protein APUTEX25_002390 [Auxenochlorella protothecoides]|eukprot:RMZ56200.1 hypothetical protein APUTEX25_002390 [Auxenochlorella protothecoides]
MHVETDALLEDALNTAENGRAASSKTALKPLSLLPLIALIFYDVAGGPFGIEDAVSSGGPLLAVLGFMVLPIVWSVPEALITAEMATTFPENSGYVAWVTAAFGPFWGFQAREGFWSWISGVTDNAVYPVMLLTYLQEGIPVFKDGWPRLVFLVGLNLTLTYLNYRGLHVVGNAAIVMTGLTLAPFVIITLLGLPHLKPANLVKSDWSAVQWFPFFNVMFWNLNYWDSVSTLAGEVRNPGKTFPRALAGAVVLVVASYLLPLIVGLSYSADAADWDLGYFAVVGDRVGGRWLGWAVVGAAMVSQVGQFEAEMSTDSYLLHGMAERGFLPAAFARKSRHGTPTLAIASSALGVLAMARWARLFACVGVFNFLEIVELLNVVYCMAMLLEFAAFIWLRIKYPSLRRPYRVPLPLWGCAAMLLPASALLLILLIGPIIQGKTSVILFTAGACVLGCTLYPLLQTARSRGWMAFRGTSPREFREILYSMYSPVPEAPAATAPPTWLENE